MMSELNLKTEQNIESVGDFKFEPIKGYPMLHWKGKRPFQSTQYYPAQLKETYGEEHEGWLNKIFWGDNLQVMSHLLKKYRGQVDLIYIDPPFDSRVDYKKKVEVRNKKTQNDFSSFEEKQYTDIWSNDEYLQFMYERLVMLRELMSDHGSIYLHCDWHKSHLLRCLMDEVFGASNFRNEISWKRGSVKGAKAKGYQFARNHDVILYYTKSSEYIFNRQYLPFSEEYKRRFSKDDNDGRGPYRDDQAIGTRSKESIQEMIDDNRIVVQKDGTLKIKTYLNELDGVVVDDNWIDISEVNVMAANRTNYPTQKPDELLERIIKASSNEGDLVFDCFMGSGTTQAVAMKMGRRFIGADINLGAVDTTVKRLLKIQQDFSGNADLFDTNASVKYTGFEVYNVNNYDIFRNPVEAKELLVKALELQPIPNSTLYDGEKDGRMVKIMPVNRIATKADLNELITNFPYAVFDKRQEETPNKPVEHITLVCMGHESELRGELTLQMKKMGYNIGVEVLDILKDKAELEFKRDASADITVEGRKLVVRDFYPMNLLQKLSLQQECVEDWTVLVDSIKIDFNYDGAVFTPTLIDIPEKNELVEGVYQIPADAGLIKIKITDLLNESYEETIKL